MQDSLFSSLESHTKKDTIRIKLLINTANSITQNDPTKAFDLVEEAFDTAIDINWIKGKALALRQKGVIYYSLSDNLNAMEAYQQALIESRPLNNSLFEASLYNNLANIYADMKLFDKALENYDTLLSIATDMNSIPDQIRALANIATVQSESGKVDEGISNLEKALRLSQQEENDYFIAAILNNLGLAYKRKEAYSTSLGYYLEANELAININNKYVEASTFNSMGKVNILLKDFRSAGKYASKGLALAEEIDAVEWQADAWEVLRKVHQHENEHKKALVAYQNHIKLRDSVISAEKIADLTQKEMQFKLEKQEALANAEISRQKLITNTTLYGGSGLIVVSIIGFMMYRRKQEAIIKTKEAEFKAQVSDTELKALRSQMNPHFIFNSLNSIGDYILKNDTESASDYLTKFAKLMRQTLENSEKKEVLLVDDISLLTTYLDIERKRFNMGFAYDIVIDPLVDPENTLVPPLILQPFIENSIIHGLTSQKGEGHIHIEIKKDQDMILYSVDDNGVGRQKVIESKPLENKVSLGMKITKSRIDIINQLKNTKGDVKVIDKDKGVRIEVSLPLELAF